MMAHRREERRGIPRGDSESMHGGDGGNLAVGNGGIARPLAIARLTSTA